MKKMIFNRLIISHIIIIFLLIPNNLSAQVYKPFPDSNAIWSVSNMKFAVLGDTVINTKNYKKYYMQYDSINFIFNINNAHYISALREENKKIFVIPKDSENELLLYKFDVNQGDTITHCSYNPFLTYTQNNISQYKSIVESIDSIQIDNIYRKRYKLINNSSLPATYTEYWIEGMGSNTGLFFPGLYNHLFPDGPIHKLLCFSYNQTIIYQLNYELNCFALNWIGIKKLNEEPYIKLSIFPNPFYDYCFISINGKHNSKKTYFIYLYSITGNIIKKTKICENEIIQFNRDNLENGLYYCILKDSNNIILTNQKIIIL